jgi:transcriptional regulator with XRE-family HTH domain
MEASYFGGRLRELREAAGLTQQQLADRCGLHRVALARLETSESVPAWDTVLSICAVLGVSSEAFRQAPAKAPRKGPGRPPTRKPADGADGKEGAAQRDAPARSKGKSDAAGRKVAPKLPGEKGPRRKKGD